MSFFPLRSHPCNNFTVFLELPELNFLCEMQENGEEDGETGAPCVAEKRPSWIWLQGTKSPEHCKNFFSFWS